MRNGHTILVENPYGKRPIGRPRDRWNDNIKVKSQEIVSEVVDCVHVSQDNYQWWVVVNTVIKFWVL
jgi:hypothetical protein